MFTHSTSINTSRYMCTNCNFKCSKKGDWSRHILTAKHKLFTNDDDKTSKHIKLYSCVCGNEYKYRQSLYVHKKKCTHNNKTNDIQNEIQYDEVQNPVVEPTSEASTLLRLLKQNDEFKQMMAEQYNVMSERLVELQEKNQELNQQLIAAIKDGNGTVINNTTTNHNNNNNHFNLNFFLNDTCKDAMNITDFLGNLDVQIEEIEYIGNHGYVMGMTKMIMDRLKDMDITKRPIHCTDIKRETMYIKDKNEWSKDTDELTKLRKILNYITMKNYKTVPKWKTAHPDCEEMDTRDYNFCYKMMQLILGDVEDEQVKLDNKIIKTLAKGLFCKSNE